IVESQEYFNRAGGTIPGFINKVFVDLLGRLPSPPEQINWLNVAAAGNIRVALPLAILFQASTEYYENLLTQDFFALLRRFPSTPPDQSRLIAPGTPFGALGFVNSLIAGAGPADVETGILASP